MKFLFQYEKRGWFFIFPVWNPAGMAIIEAKSIGDAYEQTDRDINAGRILGQKWRVSYVFQVNDDAKPSDFRQMGQIEETHRHKEEIAKHQASLSDNKTKEAK